MLGPWRLALVSSFEVWENNRMSDYISPQLRSLLDPLSLNNMGAETPTV